jgi:hypothetical protein
MNEEQLRLISRMMKTQDGKDFIAEIIDPMLKQNHLDILGDGRALRDEVVGFGNCLLFLKSIFENCDTKLAERAKQNVPNLI